MSHQPPTVIATVAAIQTYTTNILHPIIRFAIIVLNGEFSHIIIWHQIPSAKWRSRTKTLVHDSVQCPAREAITTLQASRRESKNSQTVQQSVK